MRTNDIPVVDASGKATAFYMGFACALRAFTLGKIEQVYDSTGEFVGVMLRESQSRPKECFYSSNYGSPCTISASESGDNAEAVADHFQSPARRKVAAWPYEHDRNAVVISAGRVKTPGSLQA